MDASGYVCIHTDIQPSRIAVVYPPPPPPPRGSWWFDVPKRMTDGAVQRHRVLSFTMYFRDGLFNETKTRSAIAEAMRARAATSPVPQ